MTTIRSLQKRLLTATKQITDDKRDVINILSRRWVTIAREEAPLGKTGKFREGIAADVTQDGFSAGSPSPLGIFINKGTKPHKIYPRKANALYFYWGKISKFTVVPKGGGFKTHISNNTLFIGKGFVQHPGTKPNPYVDRTFARWITEAEKQALRIADNFILEVLKA